MEQIKEVFIALKPEVAGDEIVSLKVTVRMPDAAYLSREQFDTMPVTLASCRCTCYEGGDITARDALGDVPINIEREVGCYGPQLSYSFGRDTNGELTLCYSCTLPDFDPTARNPGLSLCRHERGVTGAGLTFLLLPQGLCNFHLAWDWSDCGDDSVGIAGCENGDFSRTCTRFSFKYVYYAFGQLSEYNRPGSKLHVFTLDRDDRYFDELVEIVGEYFDHMEGFFHDGDCPYHIILYPTKRTLLTGTAQLRCCYLGFGADFIVNSLSEVEDVLAHELTHNWCSIADNVSEDEGLSSLYMEGTAEYYSSAMLYRSGQNGIGAYVSSINAKLRDYYANPFRECAYRETYDKSWTHAFAQRVPYNRGIIMFMQLDSAIRNVSSGNYSLDDLVLHIIDDGKSGKTVDWDGFVKLADEFSGGAAADIIDATLAGGLMLPPGDFFGSEYKLVETSIPIECEGFDFTVRFEPEKTIHGLIPGSNAEKAGLRNGDKIISLITDSAAPGRDLPLSHCKVIRDGEIMQFDYIARGQEASCWQYIR